MISNDEIIVTVTGDGKKPLTLLLQTELVIGRDCEGLLIADTGVSRRHLRIRRRGRAVEVTDLQSTNGTFQGAVKLDEPVLIDVTSRFSIGDTEVVVEFRPKLRDRNPFGQTTEVTLADAMRNTSINLVAQTMSSGPIKPKKSELLGETLTMVFSDIESSTERAAAMGDSAWYALLDDHNRLFRSELHRWGGTEVKSIGDGFMLTFPSVQRALRFSCEVQRQVASDNSLDLRVRIGLHTGEAISDVTGDLFGRHVNLAARVANLASGGQTLASLVVREIAAGQDDLHFGDPISAELKGFAEPQTVYEVLWRT